MGGDTVQSKLTDFLAVRCLHLQKRSTHIPESSKLDSKHSVHFFLIYPQNYFDAILTVHRH